MPIGGIYRLFLRSSSIFTHISMLYKLLHAKLGGLNMG